MAFVGRDRELSVLTELAAAARAGSGALVLLTGEAGAGKSTMVRALSDALEPDGSVVVVGRCVEEVGRPAYQPWLQIQESLGELQLLDSQEAPIRRTEEAFQAALFDDLTRAVRRTADRRELVLVIEDLHLADPDTAKLLAHLSGHLPGTTLLVVATYRPVEAQLSPGLTDVLPVLLERATEVQLQALREDAVRTLLADAGLPPGQSAAVLKRTSGNPLFVTTAIRLLRTGREIDRAEMPVGIGQAVRRQVTLAGNAHPAVPEFLASAAVVGEEFGLAEVRCVFVGEGLEEALDVAVQAGIVAEVPGKVARFAFTHALVREAVYDGISPGRRAKLHAGILDAADLLDPDEAAFHAVRAAAAGRAKDAVELSSAAAERSREVYAFNTAARHLQNALGALDLMTPTDHLLRCQLLAELAEVLGNAGDPDGARASGLRAARLAARAADPAAQAKALLAAAAHVPFLERDDELMLQLDEQVDRAEAPPAELSRMLARRAVLAAGRDSLAARDRDTERALRIGRDLGDKRLTFDLLTDRLHALWGAPDGLPTADIDELLAVATTPERTMQAHLWLLHRALDAADLGAARAEVAAIERIAARTHWGRHALLAASRRATVQTLSGEFELARESLEQAFVAGTRSQEPEAAAVRWGQLYTLSWHLELGSDELGFVEDLAQEFLTTPVHRLFRAALAVLDVRAGRIDRAREGSALAAEGVARLPQDPHLLWLLALLAWLSARLQDQQLAREVDRLLTPYDGQAIVVGGGVQWMGLVGHYRGLAAAAYDDRKAARGMLTEAARRYEQIGAGPWVVHARRDLAALDDKLDRGAERRATELGMRLGGGTPVLFLERDGELWRLRTPTRNLMLRHSLGLQYLEQLVRNPGQDISAVTLAGAPEAHSEEEVLDERARTEYRARISELEAEVAEAEERHDLARASQHRAELDFIVAELARASGLGGRSRKLGAPAERARLNVTRALRSAIARITEQDSEIGSSLAAAVHTGNVCSFRPEKWTRRIGRSGVTTS